MDWRAVTAKVMQRAANPSLRTDLAQTSGVQIGAPLSLPLVPTLEASLGFGLPQPLLDLFAHVGNGGFGPGYGLMRLAPADRPAFAGNAIAVHRFLTGIDYIDPNDPDDPTLAWPPGFLPIVHWGCSMYSVIDCLDPAFAVLFWDAERPEADSGKPIRDIIQATGLGFAEWIDRWADGNLDPLG